MINQYKQFFFFWSYRFTHVSYLYDITQCFHHCCPNNYFIHRYCHCLNLLHNRPKMRCIYFYLYKIPGFISIVFLLSITRLLNVYLSYNILWYKYNIFFSMACGHCWCYCSDFKYCCPCYVNCHNHSAQINNL